ncbi:MAG: hypothetical protein Rsou_0496 [Candidatus Ruthia sp. Asou_11_S2]|nr:hypothetical protein [Candidatus Ruthia sp. Asou_11_S2]
MFVKVLMFAGHLSRRHDVLALVMAMQYDLKQVLHLPRVWISFNSYGSISFDAEVTLSDLGQACGDNSNGNTVVTPPAQTNKAPILLTHQYPQGLLVEHFRTLPLLLYCVCFLAIKSVQASSENLLDATAVNGSGVLLPSAIHSYYAEKLAQKTACFSEDSWHNLLSHTYDCSARNGSDTSLPKYKKTTFNVIYEDGSVRTLHYCCVSQTRI